MNVSAQRQDCCPDFEHCLIRTLFEIGTKSSDVRQFFFVFMSEIETKVSRLRTLSDFGTKKFGFSTIFLFFMSEIGTKVSRYQTVSPIGTCLSHSSSSDFRRSKCSKLGQKCPDFGHMPKSVLFGFWDRFYFYLNCSDFRHSLYAKKTIR